MLAFEGRTESGFKVVYWRSHVTSERLPIRLVMDELHNMHAHADIQSLEIEKIQQLVRALDVQTWPT